MMARTGIHRSAPLFFERWMVCPRAAPLVPACWKLPLCGRSIGEIRVVTDAVAKLAVALLHLSRLSALQFTRAAGVART